MRILTSSIVAASLVACGQSSDDSNNSLEEQSNRNEAPAFNDDQVVEDVEEDEVPDSKSITIDFHPMLGDVAAFCAMDSDESNQVFSSIRFFVNNLALISSEGEISPLALDLEDDSSNLQFKDNANNEIALLNLLGDGCASLTATTIVKTSLTATVANKDYSKLSFGFGLPYAPMSPELSSVPAFLAPSDMGWMWQHFPADFQINILDKSVEPAKSRQFNHLVSADQPKIEFDIDFPIEETVVHVSMDLGKLSADSVEVFAKGIESSCNNNNKVFDVEAPVCLEALGAFGYKQEQTVFSEMEM